MIVKARFLALLLGLAGSPLFAQGSDVVVLRGGTRIDLQRSWSIQGKMALLTRTDGTLLSVPVSEIDRDATRAANASRPAPVSAAPSLIAPPATPAQAARASREGPQARVRITDADVGHEYVEAPPEAAKSPERTVSGGAKVEVGSYDQTQTGSLLIVKGTLRNIGATNASSVRLTVSGVDDKGMSFVSSEAAVSKGTIEPGESVSFGASLEVGDAIVTTFRFAPQWISAAPPGSASATPLPPGGAIAIGATGAGAGAATASGGSDAKPAGASAAAPPAPPRPFGLGTLYSAPAPPASFSPPADGKSGYIPGAASPDQQPKPPQ